MYIFIIIYIHLYTHKIQFAVQQIRICVSVHFSLLVLGSHVSQHCSDTCMPCIHAYTMICTDTLACGTYVCMDIVVLVLVLGNA